MTAELAGVPAVSIMTEQFVSAAELMAQVLGAGEYPFVVIPHPISSASVETLDAIARRAADAVVRSLTDRASVDDVS